MVASSLPERGTSLPFALERQRPREGTDKQGDREKPAQRATFLKAIGAAARHPDTPGRSTLIIPRYLIEHGL